MAGKMTKRTTTKRPRKRTKKRVKRDFPEGGLGTGMAEDAARAFREREDFLKNI